MSHNPNTANRLNNSKTISTPASDKAHPEDLQRDLDGIRIMYAAYRRTTRPADEVLAAFICIQASILRALGSQEPPTMYDDDFPEGSAPVVSDLYTPTVTTAEPEYMTVSDYARMIGLNGWNFHFATRISRRATELIKQRGMAATYNPNLIKTFPPDVLKAVFSSIV